jgi:hypothetical protein
MLTNPPTLSVAEAAAACGFTRQAVHRAIKDGRLSRFLIRDSAGHARLQPEAVGAIRSGLLRQRIDTARPAPPPPPPAPEPEAAPEGPTWEQVASWGNQLIDRAAFGLAPWSSTLWVSLSNVLDLAYEQAAERGRCTPEALAAFEAEAES